MHTWQDALGFDPLLHIGNPAANPSRSSRWSGTGFSDHTGAMSSMTRRCRWDVERHTANRIGSGTSFTRLEAS